MGIRAGSGRGSGASKQRTSGISTGGGSGAPRRPGRPQKPFRPTENTFPEKPEFRLGTYRVIEEKDDYVVCRGFDPNAKNPFAEITPDAYRTIKVAKPAALQKTPWDGSTVVIDGISYTYAYSSSEYGVRTATWTDVNGDDHDEEQFIYPPYIAFYDDNSRVDRDDHITCVEIRESAVVDGIPVDDEDGGRLSWVDLNLSGRHWWSPRDISDHPPILGTLDGSLSESGSQTITITVGGTGTETVYERMGLGDNDPLPSGTKVSAVYMEGLGYVVVGAGCPA